MTNRNQPPRPEIGPNPTPNEMMLFLFTGGLARIRAEGAEYGSKEYQRRLFADGVYDGLGEIDHATGKSPTEVAQIIIDTAE